MQVNDISGYGEIVTFTKIYKGAGHLEEPYTIAVVQLGEEQVLARIESDSDISIGQSVRYLRSDEYGRIFGL